MKFPRFRLRTLMLVVAGSGLLFGLCRGLVGLFGPSGALALVLMLLAWVSTMFLVAVTPALLCEFIGYVVERVLRRLKDDET